MTVQWKYGNLKYLDFPFFKKIELLFPAEVEIYNDFKDAPLENSILRLILITSTALTLFYLLLLCAIRYRKNKRKMTEIMSIEYLHYIFSVYVAHENVITYSSGSWGLR